MEMVLAATHVENSEGPQVKIALCIKDKGKNVFQMERFYDFEVDQPRMNHELRVMMGEL